MGPLTILQGMALSTLTAPMPMVPVESLANVTFSLPSAAAAAPRFQSTDSALPKLLPAISVDDAWQVPRITFRDGGVMEFGGKGLKFGWQF